MRCVPPRLRLSPLRCPPRQTAVARSSAARRRSSGAAGFTLIELIIALVLLALMSSLMFGSLSMAARSWDGGEAKAEAVSAMRQAQSFLREQLAAELPLRVKKAAELPLMFGGERDEIRYAAALPPRVQRGRRVFLPAGGDRATATSRSSCWSARFPIRRPRRIRNSVRRRPLRCSPTTSPSCMCRISGATRMPPTSTRRRWRDQWDDPQRLPLLMRIDVIAGQGPAVADARRRAAPRARIRMRVVRPDPQPLRGDRLMRARRSSERGIALIAVLWLTILLTVIASGFAFSMHGEAVAARNALSLAQARAAADGAVERTAFELTRPRNLPDVWQRGRLAADMGRRRGEAHDAGRSTRRRASTSTPRAIRC